MSLQRLKPQWFVLVVLIAGVVAASSFGARPAQADDPPPPSQPDVLPVDPGFTYQAVVRQNGQPVTATCFFRYGLWDSFSGGVQIGVTGTVGIVPVVNGLVTLRLNSQGTAFGPDPFKGQERYLTLEVRCGSESSFTPLLPRQVLSPTPYALSLPGLHTQPNSTSPNIIGGAFSNTVTSGVVGATISGGGSSSDQNRVTDNFGTVAGGASNRAGNATGVLDDAEMATVGGGESNSASGRLSTIAGGQDSSASGDYSFVGGGGDNSANGQGSVVVGGIFNNTGGSFATIGGGYNNTASLTATVPGGEGNAASGNWSFAAGRNAKANHAGSFVWADGSTTTGFASDRNNQFKIKAAGGVVISATATAGLTPSALEVQNGGSNSVAIHAHQISNDATLVVGNNGAGDQIKAFNAGGLVFRITNAGFVTADGTFTGGGADFAEMLPAAPDLAAGDVLVIGPDGTLARSTQAFQTSVAGVYSTKPGFVGGGSAEGSQPGDIPLAIVGVVPVCASAENGAIHPGDLLVTSTTPGCAMRAGANPPVGTVIGKALQGLASGKGQIKILVPLQ